jgi:hypothetical protein
MTRSDDVRRDRHVLSRLVCGNDGGAFGNEKVLYNDVDLNVAIVSYGTPNPRLEQLTLNN